MTRVPAHAAAALCATALICAGCGSASKPPSALSRPQTGGSIPAYLRLRMRPIGRGPRFHPRLRGRPTGSCTTAWGRRFQAHIELFARNRVLLAPGGIGTLPPRRTLDGRLLSASCYGSVVTLDDTGIVYVRAGTPATVQTLFDAWGQPLSNRRIASFTGGPVRVYLNGRRLKRDPRAVRLTPHAQIVLEIGPYVPPHASFVYPRDPQVP